MEPTPTVLPPEAIITPAVEKAAKDVETIAAELKAGNKLTALKDVFEDQKDLSAAVSVIKAGWKTSEGQLTIVTVVANLLLAAYGKPIPFNVDAICGAIVAVYAVCRTYHKST